jgi:multidrug transporter EmrE-like cation transporter
MNKRTLPSGIAFVVLGIAFIIIFKDSTPGTLGGVLLIVAGIVSLVRGGRYQT